MGVRFPVMLRQMWSGGDVQKWIDENLGWRAIETAPKDGRYVLLYDAQRAGEYLMAQWFHGAWWGRRTLSGKAITWTDATHWMPLPEPPK